MKIAILEDDQQQAELVCSWLTQAGYAVTHRSRGDSFLHQLEVELFDMALLDWELPDQSGMDVLRSIRAKELVLPVIFATQRDSENDIVEALNNGADDYLVKPLRQAELMARIEAVWRRAGVNPAIDQLSMGPIRIDLHTRTILVNEIPVKVTQKDFDVAVCLISNQGKVLSREYLLKEVWGVDAKLNTRTVDVHVSRVRRSLGINPDMGYCIRTVYQHGYRLEKIDVGT